MNRKLLLPLVVLPFLLSCNSSEGSGTNWTTKKTMPLQAIGLEGCTYVELETPFGVPTLHIIRCPNSSTSTQWETGGNKNRQRHSLNTLDGEVEKARETIKRAEALQRMTPEDRKVLGLD